MEDFISFIVKHLVDNPDAVSVERVEKESGRQVFRLHVGDGDLGQVIGKEGKTAKSIRTLVVPVAETPRMKELVASIFRYSLAVVVGLSEKLKRLPA